MLKLVNITKNYHTGDTVVQALRGVSLEFGENEFVAILGQSGCGKTTLLNIIGGLDQYTNGDLIINGVSTKRYGSSDWDLYRNSSIGFVFQSYQLIAHQTVLSNVELTMTLSGISKAERRRRAIDALREVGLADQINKKPNQMSGGQMQRTAIARALVNDPDIILADEPTGALDSATSIQIMEILKEVSKDRLVIMVTHNPELAQTYATRIVRLVDGKVTEDRSTADDSWKGPEVVEVVGTDPTKSNDENYYQEDLPVYASREDRLESKKKAKKTSMSFLTALSLSLKNLMTKKGRTLLTAFAGAIGIIGIAMILALSTGVQNYIDNVESDTLSSYPLSIYRETVDFAEMMSSMMPTSEEKPDQAENSEEERKITEIRSNNMMTNMITSIANDKTENDMAGFKKFADNNSELKKLTQSIEYSYSTQLNVYREDGLLEGDTGLMRVNPSTVMDHMGMTGSTSSSMMTLMSGSYDVWASMPKSREMMESMYEVVDGRLPENYDEIVLAVTESGRLGDYTLYTLGFLDQSELKDLMNDVMAGKEIEKKEVQSYQFKDIYNLKFKVLPNYCYYEEKKDGTYEDKSDDNEYLQKMLDEEGIELKVVGIVSVKQNATSDITIYGGLLYQPTLMDELIDRINRSDIVKKQKEHEETDVFTGIDFPTDDDEEVKLTMEDLEAYIQTLEEEEQQTVSAMIMAMKGQGMSDEEIVDRFTEFMVKETDATYRGNLNKLGVADPEDPSFIMIYPVDFEAKERIVEILDEYSAGLPEGEELKYSDYVGLIMSSITTIINVITYILIGFVGISLVVSSIMIGIITYISVMERTREIGILRAIGASKRDISRVFNAETLIIGFISGIIGVAVPYVVSIFVNVLVYNRFDVENIMYLAPLAAVVLVVISMLLTLIGGLIPSKLAAKKDPVEALRTE